ncbi:sporulation membrane protein YtaF [Ammoniphilus resinae]|uniref:Sporulation protein YtaF n=1 Tax=Ammoniphilus resinae TaxID=861532 RepID=A0ABS4GIQ7_9BACL|nr:putative sporulation protein YtaF [Ammoniphilus resinae]
MFAYLSLFALAFAVSLDGFGVGLSYGLRKIRIPAFSVLIITFCSSLMILLSMGLGEWLASFTNVDTQRNIGGWILIIVGCWTLVQFFRSKETTTASEHPPNHDTPTQVLKINIKTFGLVIQILRMPSAADVDRSGTITGFEAVLLGTALSLDAFGAGFGASLLGFSPWLTAASVSIFNFLLISFGMKVGFTLAKVKKLQLLSFIPGIILVMIGFFKLIS